jgi:SAM-dependent methyltransferase
VNRDGTLDLFETASFDVVYCRLVLQHVPPALVATYIPELIRVLAPAGVVMFQIPEKIAPEAEDAFVNAPVIGSGIKQRLPMSVVRIYRLLKYRLIVGSAPVMAMFGISRDTVVELIRNSGGRILAIEPDRSHGTDVPGFEYWVTR